MLSYWLGAIQKKKKNTTPLEQYFFELVQT